MGVLKNARHEKFAQAIASGLNHAQAHKQAGYKGKARSVNADDLLKNPKVAARIKELQTATAERAEVTQDSLVAECEDLAARSRVLADMAGYAAAIRLKAQITGNLVRERDNARQPVTDVPDTAVLDELVRLRREREDSEKAKGLH